MSAPLTPSQTVGPFFGVGLPFEKGEQIAPPGSAGVIRIEGQVLDGNGEPVPDALLEIWQPDERGRYRRLGEREATGFGRCRSDAEGAFSFMTVKPGATPAPDGRPQAPHLYGLCAGLAPSPGDADVFSRRAGSQRDRSGPEPR